MTKLLDKIEDYHERNEKLFQDCDGGDEREASQTGDEEEKELKFLISSLDGDCPSRPVHMPGYPE